MSFLPRELFALALRESSPFLRNPQIFILFNIILFVLQIPFLFKIIHFLSPILGFIQGANQARFYASIIRRLDSFKTKQNQFLLLGLILLLLDQFIKVIFGDLLCGFQTIEMAGLPQSLRVCIVVIIMYVSTNPTPLAKYFGQYPGKLPPVFLFLILGLYGFAAALPDSKVSKNHNQHKENKQENANHNQDKENEQDNQNHVKTE